MSQRVSIITGAGSGVGAAIASKLATLGDACVLVGRTRSKLEETQSTLDSDTLIVEADLGTHEDRARIVESTLERFGTIGALINNAGLAISKQIHQQSDEDFDKLFATNGIGPVDLARRVIPTMLKAKSGVIVSVASMANIDPFPGLGLYGCSKGPLSVLPKAIQNEYGRRGIRAYSLCPGAIETGMLRSFVSEQMLPTSQTLSPEQVADAVVAMVTEETDADPGAIVAMPSH